MILAHLKRWGSRKTYPVLPLNKLYAKISVMAWTQRDNVPGKIYLMKALGYHGLIPGCLIGRYKIGLSRNPEARLDQLHSNQPPCDLEIIHTIDVDDMALVEKDLHQVFKNSSVKLVKSREYFDLNPWQVQRCLWLMNQADIKRVKNPISTKAIAGGLIALLGVGMLIGQSFKPEPQATKAINQTIIKKSVKHK